MDERRALSLVLQFLDEGGFKSSLAALQTESGINLCDEQFSSGGQLMEALHQWHELRISQVENKGSAQREADAELLQPGNGKYVRSVAKTIHSHSASVLSVRFHSDAESTLVASGAADKTVKITDWRTGEVTSFHAHHQAGVIALDWHPTNHKYLLSGSMDHTHALYDVSSKSVVASWKQHAKYVVRVRWSPKGDLFATASYDKSVCIYRGEAPDFNLVKQLTFPTTVEAIEFSADGATLFISIREDNYIHCIDLNSFQDNKFNVNATGDDHVSFNILNLVLSPDPRYLLVSTDKDRLMLFRLSSGDIARNFYGAANDALSQPRAAFDPTGKYVYSTSQGNRIYVWDVATQKTLEQLSAHAKTVRDIHAHPSKSLLASASYDQTVVVWQ